MTACTAPLLRAVSSNACMLVALFLVAFGCAGKDHCRSNEDCLPWRTCSAQGICMDGAQGGTIDHSTSSSSVPNTASSSGGTTSSTGGASSGPTQGSSSGGGGNPCELDERYVIIRNDAQAPVQVLRPSGRNLVEVVPTGFRAGDGALMGSGITPSPRSGVLQGDRLLVMDPYTLYAIDASTLVPTQVTSSQQRVAQSSGELAAMLGPFLTSRGTGTAYVDTRNPSWTFTSQQGPGGSYHRVSVFTIDGQETLVAAGRDAVELWRAGATAPQLVDSVEDEPRLGNFLTTAHARALAYDVTTDSLLFGHQQRLLIFHPTEGLTLPTVSSDWLAPEPTESIHSAAAENGRAWVGTNTTLYLLDLTQNPPVQLDAVSVMNGGGDRDVVLGCHRVVVLSSNRISSFERTDLTPLGSIPVTSGRAVLKVTRTHLALEGDAP